jgi:hypothetical protein
MFLFAYGQYTRGISAAPVTAEELGEFSEIFFYSVVGFFYSISLYCIVGLWKKSETILIKLYWTLILLLPVFGVLFYGAFFQPKKRNK